ncbi:hypothetical protein ACHAXA_004155 [Cyclostephanos tholiformis]|uniref:Uncharacterized protein n=1 Tax=Cyclostephanos tholiformis TaxID=382380 RepID=A0ABD3R7U9_9STRA
MKLSIIGATVASSSIGTLAFSYSQASSFVPLISHRRYARPPRVSTAIYLEDRIAKMIDGEMDRLNRIGNADGGLKSRAMIESTIPPNFDFEEVLMDPPVAAEYATFPVSGVDRSISMPLRRKDERLAKSDPMGYCADRCVTTGNCDVFEDMFDMDPKEVIKFCTECVLSDDEMPCDVPEGMFGNIDDDLGLHP